MFGMVFSALLRRRAPAVTLLLLTILAAGAAAAAPQYVAAATRDVATADLVARPIGDRTVTVDKTYETGTLTEDAVRRAGAKARERDRPTAAGRARHVPARDAVHR